jgi:hypothetical protein
LLGTKGYVVVVVVVVVDYFELTETSLIHFLMEHCSLGLGMWAQLLFGVMRKTLRML